MMRYNKKTSISLIITIILLSMPANHVFSHETNDVLNESTDEYDTLNKQSIENQKDMATVNEAENQIFIRFIQQMNRHLTVLTTFLDNLRDVSKQQPDIHQMYQVMSQPITVPNNCSQDQFLQSISDEELPNAFSWKNINGEDWTTPVKNQGNCGSCWDFAAMGALEAMINIQYGDSTLDMDLSEQYVLSCLPKAANNYGEGCLGGNPYNAFKYLMDDGAEGNFHNGAITESCFSYYADHQIDCDEKCEEWENELIPLADCGYSWPGFDSPQTREFIKSKLYVHGPLAVGIDCTNHFINWGTTHHDSDDYYPDMNQEWNNVLNHLVVLVGWKDDDTIPNGGYWICKNSWGPSWGYDGFYNAEYGSMFTGAFISWVSCLIEGNNTPPVKPETPIGPSTSTIDEEQYFSTSSSDAENDNISFLFDWGDGTFSEWSDPIQSGEYINISHAWIEKGSYEVRAIAKDEQGLVSSWSEPFSISLMKTKSLSMDDRAMCCIMQDSLIPETVSNTNIPVTSSNDFPSYFSWKDDDGKDWTTPAKHQGDCGSCWDFAAMGALESLMKIREENSEINPDLSEQYVLSCLPKAANNFGQGCLGGTPYHAFQYLMQEGEDGNYCNGAILESSMQYGADHTIPCESKSDEWMNQLIPIIDCGEQFLGLNNQHILENVKDLLYNHGPIAAGMNASEEFIRWGSRHHKQTDYFSDPDMPWGNRLNHMILIVGWKDDETIPNGGYWICKNSWGPSWGYDGFYNIEYGGLFTGSYVAWVDYNVTNYHPYKPQSIEGPSSGLAEELYTFSSVSSDPENSDLFYCFDWGDGELSDWLGPFASNNACETEHSWSKKGSYAVRVKVKDMNGFESAWSDPFMVSLPRYKKDDRNRDNSIINLLSFLLNIMENYNTSK